jgi:hypothetical protein
MEILCCGTECTTLEKKERAIVKGSNFTPKCILLAQAEEFKCP